MTQYLLSMYQPDGRPPPPEILGPIMTRVRTWDTDLRAAGAWVFTAGLFPADTATVVRPGTAGEVLTTDGPYVEAKEHVGGLTVIRAADLDEALRWAGRLSQATGLPTEVRPVQEAPPAATG
jgi:hypothetical protein